MAQIVIEVRPEVKAVWDYIWEQMGKVLAPEAVAEGKETVLISGMHTFKEQVLDKTAQKLKEKHERNSRS